MQFEVIKSERSEEVIAIPSAERNLIRIVILNEVKNVVNKKTSLSNPPLMPQNSFCGKGSI